MVYDVTNPESLDSVVTWKKDIDEKVNTIDEVPSATCSLLQVKLSDGSGIPCILLANKVRRVYRILCAAHLAV